MVAMTELRQKYGDVVETATMARFLLDPVARKLSGDPSEIHRRCVIARYLDISSHPDGVRDDLALFGSIEAVAVLDLLQMAVVVFWDEASAASALQRQAEIPSPGWFAAVPPLDVGFPLPGFPDGIIVAELYPPVIPATGTLPLFRFRNSPHEPAVMAPLRREPGTTWFTPSKRSRVHGPVVGADGHLWMDGLNVLFHDDGGTLGFWIEPTTIRVAPLHEPVGDDPVTYVPLFGTAADVACLPQNLGAPLVPAPTAMLDLLNLRELHGDVVETATIARDILVPLLESGRLLGDPSKLHRRCVLAWYNLDGFTNPDEVRDDLALFGAIEAVAVSERVHKALIVFWAETSVVVTLGRQGEARHGWFTAVPPLDAALPLCFIPPSSIQVALYPRAPTAWAPPRPLRPLLCFKNSPHEPLIRGPGDAGTTWFRPSDDSLLHGPVLGPDDHLWMDGINILYYEYDTVGRIDPSWIRVAPLNSPGIYCGQRPVFVPFFSVSTS